MHQRNLQSKHGKLTRDSGCGEQSSNTSANVRT
ncbi:Uncharacterised protein [Vibrio cholerae]|nr:Uncharacterised protein [Vibrio cholerae]